MKFMVAFKNLVIGITHYFFIVIDKSLVQRQYDGLTPHVFIYGFKNIIKPLRLLGIGTTDVILIPQIVMGI